MSIPRNHPSLCIPRVFPNITEAKIVAIFSKLRLGHIARVDMIDKRSPDGEHVKRVFIHFEHWFDTDYAWEARNRVLSGKDIKVVYDNPWFWKVSASHCGPQASGPKPRDQPFIDFDDSPRPRRDNNNDKHNDNNRCHRNNNNRHNDNRDHRTNNNNNSDKRNNNNDRRRPTTPPHPPSNSKKIIETSYTQARAIAEGLPQATATATVDAPKKIVLKKKELKEPKEPKELKNPKRSEPKEQKEEKEEGEVTEFAGMEVDEMYADLL